MLREIRIDVILVILLAAAVTIFVLNTTAEFGPFATGQIGLPSDSSAEATAEPTAESADEMPSEDATQEPTAEVTAEATAEATEE